MPGVLPVGEGLTVACTFNSAGESKSEAHEEYLVHIFNRMSQLLMALPAPYRDTIAARDRSVAERDTSIAGHQRQIEALTDRLKVIHCVLQCLTIQYQYLLPTCHYIVPPVH